MGPSTPLLLLLVLGLASCQEPASASLPTPVVAPKATAEDVSGDSLLAGIRLGDSPEAFARCVDAQPTLRRRFGNLCEVDLTAGTFTLRPIFEDRQLVRLEIGAPRRTEEEAARLLANDIDNLEGWVRSRHGKASESTPLVPGTVPQPPRSIARWQRSDRTLELRLVADEYLVGAELWIDGPVQQ